MQPGEELVVDVLACYRHSIGKFERSAFGVSVQRASCVIVQRVDLLIRKSQTAADRSVYILSKLTPVQESYSPVQQGLQLVGN